MENNVFVLVTESSEKRGGITCIKVFSPKIGWLDPDTDERLKGSAPKVHWLIEAIIRVP